MRQQESLNPLEMNEKPAEFGRESEDFPSAAPQILSPEMLELQMYAQEGELSDTSDK